MRDKRPGEKCRDRIGRCPDQRRGGKRYAASLPRHQFGQIGIDGDELDADADAGKKAPDHQADIAGLQRHDEGGDAVPDQRIGEDGPPAEIVGQWSQPLGADEHADEGRRDEARIAVDVEEPLGGRHHEPRLVEAGCDERDQAVVEHVEEGPERQQDRCSDAHRAKAAADPCVQRWWPRALSSARSRSASRCCRSRWFLLLLRHCLAIASLHQLCRRQIVSHANCAEPRPGKTRLPSGRSSARIA